MADNNENIIDLDDEENIVELEDENGVTTRFELLDYIVHNEEEFIVLVPADEDADEVTILKVEPINDEMENYVPIEDNDLLQEIFEIFKQRNDDIFDFD